MSNMSFGDDEKGVSFGDALINLYTKSMSHPAIDVRDKKLNELLEAKIASLTQRIEDEKGVLDKIGDFFGCAASRRPSDCERDLQKYIKILENRRREHDENMDYISKELKALLDARNKGPKGGAKPCTKKHNKSNKRICRRPQIRIRTRGRTTRTRIRGRDRLLRFG